MDYKCPGQDKRNIKVEILTCSDCGEKVELFSDEIKAHCPRCKGLVCRSRLPSCVEWCKAARQCIGEEKWKELNNKENPLPKRS